VPLCAARNPSPVAYRYEARGPMKRTVRHIECHIAVSGLVGFSFPPERLSVGRSDRFHYLPSRISRGAVLALPLPGPLHGDLMPGWR
jgi:hypothetical protein